MVPGKWERSIFLLVLLFANASGSLFSIWLFEREATIFFLYDAHKIRIFSKYINSDSQMFLGIDN